MITKRSLTKLLRKRTVERALLSVTVVCFAVFNVLSGCGKKTDRKDEFPPQGEFVSGQTDWPKVKYRNGQTSINDRCVVERHRLSRNVPPVYVNGKPVGFCSARCADLFLKNPGKYLKSMNVSLMCPVDSTAHARINAGSCAFVNYEVYFLASPDNLRAFIRAPYKYSGAVTDPVSGERFHPGSTSPRRTRGGRVFYFSAETNAREFDERRDQFAPPRVEMIHPK